MINRLTAIILALATLAVPTAVADTLYGEDLCWRLATPSDIRRVSTIRARLRKESTKAEAIFVLTPPPFGDIPAAINRTHSTKKQTMWNLPPWPSVDPPVTDDMSDDVRQAILARTNATPKAADVWGTIPVAGDDLEKPSPWLQPKVIPLDEKFVFRNKEIPAPFSLRRYYDRSDVFVELAAYGGTSLLKAEEAFRAIKESATRQKKMEGIGEEAFLTRVIITEELPEEKPEPEPKEEEVPFGDLAPLEQARPDLADSAKATAMLAPAFQGIEVKDLIGKRVTFPKPKGKKKYRAKTGKIKNSLIVLVAFFPDERVTLSFVLEERLGSVQDLIAVAFMAQRKLKEEIEPDA